MTISGSQVSQLNRANKANQQILLGTMIQNLENIQFMRSGSLSVTAAQANGSSITIYTAVANPTGYIISLYSSSGSYSGSATPYVVASTSGSLTILPNAAYKVSTGQIINWIVY